MQTRQVSQSTLFPSIFYAAHQIIDQDPKILKDPIAIGLVEGSSEDEIKANIDQFQSPLAKLMRSAFILRHRFNEDQLEEAVKLGIKQYIILGSGLDTFAYRQPDWAKNIQIIEIDLPHSQHFKLSRLRENGIKIPDNVKFISGNFETESISKILDRQNINSDIPTFFSSIAVTQFLSERANEEIFRFVASLPNLSRISLTITFPDSKIEGLEAELRSLAKAGSAAAGEPWISEYDPFRLIESLKTMGYREIKHLTPELAQSLYFKNRSDGLMATVSEQCLCAIV